MIPFHPDLSLVTHALHFVAGHAALMADAADAAPAAPPHVNAFKFAIQRATPEGKTTMGALLILSLFSWTIIITKARQILIARKWTKKFMEVYASPRSDGHQAQGRGV